MSGSEIGSNCIIGQNVFIASHVRLGNNVKVQNNVSLYHGVLLEDDVFCGPSMVFTNVLNPRAAIEKKSAFRTTLVGRGATLGANSTVVCGNSIGAYSMVGAGAVVTRPVAPHALIIGNPGRQIGWVCECGETLKFNERTACKCIVCGLSYGLKEEEVVRL